VLLLVERRLGVKLFRIVRRRQMGDRDLPWIEGRELREPVGMRFRNFHQASLVGSSGSGAALRFAARPQGDGGSQLPDDE
jgi:hypothetical protein